MIFNVRWGQLQFIDPPSIHMFLLRIFRAIDAEGEGVVTEERLMQILANPKATGMTGMFAVCGDRRISGLKVTQS